LDPKIFLLNDLLWKHLMYLCILFINIQKL
jgi:hypothetical protein